MVQPIRTSERSKCIFQPKWPKCPWSTLGWPNVKHGQNPYKTTLLKVLHKTQAFRRFLATLIKLTWSWLLVGSKNPNFDLVVRTGWNQCHCENYQILSPTTNHRLKSELEWPKYHENRDNTLIDAPLTFKSHNFWSDRWIFKFHTFSQMGS